MNTATIHQAVELPDPEVLRKKSEAERAERRREIIMQQRLMHMRYEDFDCPDVLDPTATVPIPSEDEWETMVNQLLA